MSMFADTLKRSIRKAALAYARRQAFPVDESHPSALIFCSLADGFHPESFANIQRNTEWKRRTEKTHPNVPGVLEMQSSNSSDALLMNIFCHPSIEKWAGVREILGHDLESIAFGVPGNVCVHGGSLDTTEIDLALPGVFCEAKLTESDFKQKRPAVVEAYDNLQTAFYVDALPRAGEDYDNYQVIRNLLACIAQGRAHILFCDVRRPDLVRRYADTVLCLRDIQMRRRCRVIFWQEVVAACGGTLRQQVEEKYGMTYAP